LLLADMPCTPLALQSVDEVFGEGLRGLRGDGGVANSQSVRAAAGTHLSGSSQLAPHRVVLPLGGGEDE